MIKGLMTRNFDKDYRANEFGLLINANVVRLEWKRLEPEQGVFSGAQLALVEEASRLGPVRLRINGGTEAPDWVVKDNNPFPYHEGQAGITHDCPQWWNDSYIEAWEAMMLRVYNEVGMFVTDVAQSGGGTRYSEPFIRSVWHNKEVFNQIGFDFGVDEKALNRFQALMTRIWRHKQLSMSVLAWQYMEGGKPKASMDRSIAAVMRWNPDSIGAHDLREVPGAARLARWDSMYATGIPMYFQTASPQRIGDWEKALSTGLLYNAQNIELPWNFTTYDYQTLAKYAWAYKG